MIKFQKKSVDEDTKDVQTWKLWKREKLYVSTFVLFIYTFISFCGNSYELEYLCIKIIGPVKDKML